MPSLNKIIVIGNLGKDPEMRFTPSGKPVTSFSVAVSNRYQKEGEWKEDTQWFTVITWGKLAEICSQHLAKGQSVYVEGSIKLHEWERKDGENKSSLEITASQVKFLTPNQKAETRKGDGDIENDIPF